MEETSVEVAFSLPFYSKQKYVIHRLLHYFAVHKNEEKLYKCIPILVAG